MRIVVSGTHASGKSTLIADFAERHPEFRVLGDPFETIDVALDEPDASTYSSQLTLSAARLMELPPGSAVIAERGPLDFLAYLDALVTLGRPTKSPALLAQGVERTGRAMSCVDLLVLLPLNDHDDIDVSADEDLELRYAMNEALFELSDDPDITGDVRTIEIVGERDSRLRQLHAAIEESRSH